MASVVSNSFLTLTDIVCVLTQAGSDIDQPRSEETVFICWSQSHVTQRHMFKRATRSCTIQQPSLHPMTTLWPL